MSEFQIKNINEIDLGYGNLINHFAFDGCSYFFTVMGENKIIKTDKNFNVVEVYNTYREYNCICYDCKECCFYVTCKNCCTCIYKLDCCMREVGCTSLRSCCNQNIVGMSYNCGNNTIMLAFVNSIYEMKKNCGECVRQSCPTNCTVTGILSICPGYVVTAFKEKKYYIFIIDQCGKIVITGEIECGVIIQDMVFNPCDENCKLSFVDCLSSRDLSEMCVSRQPICETDLGYSICPCNFDLCHKICCRCSPCDCLDPCGNVLQSIALIETALAHILNAEGEKIQKAVANCNDMNEILCVNKSVAKTISKVSFLEQVLLEKIEAVNESCCCNSSCCDKECEVCPCDEENECDCLTCDDHDEECEVNTNPCDEENIISNDVDENLIEENSN